MQAGGVACPSLFSNIVVVRTRIIGRVCDSFTFMLTAFHTALCCTLTGGPDVFSGSTVNSGAMHFELSCVGQK